MMGRRLTLVADDQRLGQALQGWLKETTGLLPFVCRGEAVFDQLAPPCEGPLLVACTLPGGPEQLLRTVQSLRLQRFCPPILVREGDEAAYTDALRLVEPHLAGQFRWPAEADSLAQLLQSQCPSPSSRSGRGGPTNEESITEVIRRRLLACTPSLLPMVECLVLAALHDVTVLMTGETGTGKTFLARLMHDCSSRRSEPFLTVPCGAQPVTLIESVFFGHVKGAFTGADRNKEGKFAAAGRGTLLLDEIDTLPLEAQAGLLRVIETGEYEPVGSNQTLRCQARLIVASNWDLEEATRQGRFRTDLYYRLNVMSFHLPPLRERVEDIEPLVRAMAARCNRRFRKDLFDIHPEALAALESFDWPGNIRQLENIVQQAVLMSKGPELRLEDLPALVREGRKAAVNGHPAAKETLEDSRRNAEKAVILRALQAHNFNRTQTARALGISRVTLFKKMKTYGLSAPPRTRSLEIPGPNGASH
jgi:DNA-binding NtrC family response regulator